MERGNDANASKQDGFTLDVEPDANLLSSLNYLACCVNPHAAATQPTDGLCLYVSNGSAGDKKVATPPATVTVMLENGAAFIAPGSHLSTPLAMVACSRAQIVKWLSGDSPLVRELPANWCVCIAQAHGHDPSFVWSLFCLTPVVPGFSRMACFC